MKWLAWSRIDLEFGLGGVEEHARSLARELRLLGVDVSFSRDEKDLQDESVDVIHTHGHGVAPRSHPRAVRLHTLHGTTLGRMAACGEWFWPRGYWGEGREILAVLRSDAVLSVHPELSLFRLAKSLGRVTRDCGNGWDSGTLGASMDHLPPEILSKIDRTRPLWLYVGRGVDLVKGADRVRSLLAARPEMQLVAVPGSGYEQVDRVLKTGRMTATQVSALMEIADGMLSPSRYEGNSLAILEALASGLVVLSTPVGAVPILPKGVLGLESIPAEEFQRWQDAASAVESAFADRSARLHRREVNRSLLPRWADVARSALDAVQEVQARRKS